MAEAQTPETHKDMKIQGAIFSISTPYQAGHPLTEIEAHVLNQTRGENVRNNVAKQVKELLEAGDEAGAKALVAEYDTSYEFTLRAAGGSRQTLDPVEKQARKIARELIRAKLASQGRKVKDVDKEAFAAKVIEVAASEKIQKLAKKQVAEQEKAIDDSLGELSIG